MTRIFVYGTLRRGLWNNHLLAGAKYLGVGSTRELFRMHYVFGGGFPVVYRDARGYVLRGDVYEVDARTLGVLDQLERHPDWYRREPAGDVVLDDLASQVITNAQLYVVVERAWADPAREVRSGDYKAEETIREQARAWEER